jgi:hypothetical protein
MCGGCSSDNNQFDLSSLGGGNDLPRCSGRGCVSFPSGINDLDGGGVMNSVLLPSIALNCLPGCCTRMFNCSGILD